MHAYRDGKHTVCVPSYREIVLGVDNEQELKHNRRPGDNPSTAPSSDPTMPARYLLIAFETEYRLGR